MRYKTRHVNFSHSFTTITVTWNTVSYLLTITHKPILILSQTTNFKLFQSQRVYRQQFQI